MTKQMTRGNGYLRTLQQPFTAPPTHIPDQVVQESGLVTSRTYGVFTPSGLGGTSTTHNGGMLILPNANYAVITLAEVTVGAGTLSDTNLAGNALVGGVSVPNFSSLFSQTNNAGARIRPVSIGVRVTYEGTELNRSGRYYAGLCPVSGAAVSSSATPFPLSPLSTICSSSISTLSNLRNCMTELSTARVSDGTFEFHWLPVNVPSYQ